MLVITGTQRSGTTMMAKAVYESGYSIGSAWTDEVGGYEHLPTCDLYSKILDDQNFPWEGIERTGFPVATLVDRFQEVHLYHDAVKFSFLFMHKDLLKIWQRYRPPTFGDVFLIMHRNASDVIASKRRPEVADVFAKDSNLLKQTAGELARNRLVTVATAIHLGYPTILMPFPEILEIPLARINTSLALANIAIAPEAWKPDPKKVHFAS